MSTRRRVTRSTASRATAWRQGFWRAAFVLYMARVLCPQLVGTRSLWLSFSDSARQFGARKCNSIISRLSTASNKTALESFKPAPSRSDCEPRKILPHLPFELRRHIPSPIGPSQDKRVQRKDLPSSTVWPFGSIPLHRRHSLDRLPGRSDAQW